MKLQIYCILFLWHLGGNGNPNPVHNVTQSTTGLYPIPYDRNLYLTVTSPDGRGLIFNLLTLVLSSRL